LLSFFNYYINIFIITTSNFVKWRSIYNFDEECEIYTAKLYTPETTCSTGNSRV